MEKCSTFSMICLSCIQLHWTNHLYDEAWQAQIIDIYHCPSKLEYVPSIIKALIANFDCVGLIQWHQKIFGHQYFTDFLCSVVYLLFCEIYSPSPTKTKQTEKTCDGASHRI